MIVGRIFKALLLRPRVRKMTWHQLLSGAGAEREKLLAILRAETEATASVHTGGEMSIRETLAHMAEANLSIAGRLDSLRAGQIGDSSTPDLFPGAEGLTLEDVKSRYEESWKRLAGSAAQPIDSPQTIPHEFFGPINAKEWVALIAFHHEYHLRKIDRIKRSREYMEAQGLKW